MWGVAPHGKQGCSRKDAVHRSVARQQVRSSSEVSTKAETVIVQLR